MTEISAANSPRSYRCTEVWFVLCSALVALLVRLSLVSTQTVINSDGIYYATLGKKLIAGDLTGGISAYWSPLYPFLIGFVSLFTSDLEFAGRLVSVLAGALLIVPGYILIREFYGSAAAVLGTILLVIHPMLLISSVWVMTEATYIVTFTAMVLCGWRAISTGNSKYYFATGLFVGLAYLTKPESITFVGLFVVLAIGMKFVLPGITLRSVVIGGVLLSIGFSIFFMPYFVCLHEKTGRWTISQKIVSNVPSVGADRGLLKLTDDGSTTMRDRLFTDVYESDQPAAETASSAPTPSTPKSWNSRIQELATRTLANLRRQAGDHIRVILPIPFLLLIVLGFIRTPRNVTSIAREIYLLVIVACILLGYAATVVELRYSFALIPIFMAWTSRGIVEFTETLKRLWPRFEQGEKRIGEIVLQGIVVSVLIAFLVPSFLKQFEPGNLSRVALEEKAAGLWIKDQAASHDPPTVMSSSPTVAFYGGADHVYVPDEEFPTVMAYARRKKVDYLVFGERRSRNTPNAFPKDKNGTEGLSLVYNDEQDPQVKVLIWKLDPQ